MCTYFPTQYLGYWSSDLLVSDGEICGVSQSLSIFNPNHAYRRLQEGRVTMLTWDRRKPWCNIDPGHTHYCFYHSGDNRWRDQLLHQLFAGIHNYKKSKSSSTTTQKRKFPLKEVAWLNIFLAVVFTAWGHYNYESKNFIIKKWLWPNL